jgi:hypothetical protein
MRGVGEIEREQGALFQDEEIGAGFSADEKGGEGGEVRLVAEEGDVAAVFGVEVQAFGELARIVLGEKAGDFDAEGVGEEEACGEFVGRLAGAEEGAVPKLGWAEDGGGAEEAGEAGDFAAAAGAERAGFVLFLGKGVGVAQEVEQHARRGSGGRRPEARGARRFPVGAG